MNEGRTRSRLNSPDATPARGNGPSPKTERSRTRTEEPPEAQIRQILAAMDAFRDGDFSVRLPTNWSNTNARLSAAFNQTIAQKQRMSEEVVRLTESVGKQGRLRQRISLPGGIGGWAAEADAVNTLIDDLVRPTTEIARTIGAVAKGDLAESMDLEVDGRELKGEFLRSAKLVNAMIQQLAAFISEADRRKDEFLATLAHELRNPLAPIRNAVQILRAQGAADPASRKLQDIIDRQIGQMARIVDDLLDVSRISRGKLELRKGRVTLQQVLQGAVETSRPLIDQSHHHLEVRMPAKPLVLDADLTRLSQVFANLLNNAAKFTQTQGRIQLVAEERGAEVVVSVIDSGVGIPAPQMANLFDLFSQGEAARRLSGGGLGIGLSLVKQLVELHQGRVTARSDGPGQGSEFTVHLPLARDQSAPCPPDATPARQRTADRRLRVLVVDDSEDAALTLATLLELAGYEPHLAHDGEQALAVAEACRPDVVLLDIGLPKLSGNEVCWRLRQQDWGRHMTVIALTGWGQEQDRRRTTEAGFNHHLVKPADPAALLKLLGEVEV